MPTAIEWTDATWNPVRGCTRVSEGCRNCYAERQAARNLPGMRSPTTGESFATMTEHGPRWTGAVELIPEKLSEPLRWRKPRRIFVNSMSDLFHEALGVESIAQVFAVMLDANWHTFQVLTKRPERAAKLLGDPSFVGLVRTLWTFLCLRDHSGLSAEDVRRESERLPWPLPNVWLGTSVEDQATADARIAYFLRCPAAVRFVSYEPALGCVDFALTACHHPHMDGDGSGGWICQMCGDHLRDGRTIRRGIDWLICGGESGPGARPFDIDWARSAVVQCRNAGVPCFVKQMGSYPVYRDDAGTFLPEIGGYRTALHLHDRKGGDMSEWPEDLRVREFPA